MSFVDFGFRPDTFGHHYRGKLLSMIAPVATKKNSILIRFRGEIDQGGKREGNLIISCKSRKPNQVSEDQRILPLLSWNGSRHSPVLSLQRQWHISEAPALTDGNELGQ
jgi:hypothetical protein